jgi:hypothetical protein
MSYLAFDLVGKRIELLKEWVPQVQHVAVLARPQHPGEHRERQATQEVIDKLGMLLSYFPTPDLTKMDEIFRAVLLPQIEVARVKPVDTMPPNLRLSDNLIDLMEHFSLSSAQGIGRAWGIPLRASTPFDERYGQW